MRKQVKAGGGRRPGVMCDKRASPRMIRRCRREQRRRRCTILRKKTAGRAGGSGDQNVDLLFGGAELVGCFGDKEIGDGCRQEGR